MISITMQWQVSTTNQAQTQLPPFSSSRARDCFPPSSGRRLLGVTLGLTLGVMTFSLWRWPYKQRILQRRK